MLHFNFATTSLRLRSFGIRIVIGAFLSFACSYGVARAQTADSFDPNANNTIRALVIQPDGKILIGGDFTSLSPNGGPPVTRIRVARLNADGSLDAAFNPTVSSQVFTIAVQADGKVLIGGNFTSVGGQTRNYIARLDAVTGAVDMSFNPDAEENVLRIAVQPDGKILVGGNFRSVFGGNSIGGAPRNRIARLDPTTGLADSFDPNASDWVEAFLLQSDGSILIGGNFTTLAPNGGPTVTRNRIARLNSDGTVDPVFDPNANTEVRMFARQGDGKILVAGDFHTIGGLSRNCIARLDPTTGAPDSFDPNADTFIMWLYVQPNGKILVGGQFTGIGGATRSGFARIDPLTGLADPFNPNPNGGAYAFAMLPDGRIIVGGNFTRIGGQFRNYAARLLNPPTAAGVSVSGRVLTPDGRGLRNAYTVLTDIHGVARRAITGPLGYYHFDDAVAGETYVIGVASKLYTFSPRTISVADELTDVDLVADGLGHAKPPVPTVRRRALRSLR